MPRAAAGRRLRLCAAVVGCLAVVGFVVGVTIHYAPLEEESKESTSLNDNNGGSSSNTPSPRPTSKSSSETLNTSFPSFMSSPAPTPNVSSISSAPSSQPGPKPKVQCQTVTLNRSSFEPMVPSGYRVLQATVHSRHLNRWMYRHSFIDNVCWENQQNSTELPDQCQYNRSTVWKSFDFSSDPYATPVLGYCNAKQLTVQGRENARRLGQLYTTMFDDPICDYIELESSEDSQKNLLSLQDMYYGICGQNPDPTEFTFHSIAFDGVQRRGSPFFLRTSVCRSTFLASVRANASIAYRQSDYMPPLRETAAAVANQTGKVLPENDASLPTLLDNIYDCMVSHECHGMEDLPEGLWEIRDDMDVLETLSRLYVFEYMETQPSRENYRRFVANYFGYYFTTVLHRMQIAVNATKDGTSDGNFTRLYVQVTSDSVVSPQLRILGLPKEVYERRPAWGSGVVYQLLQNITDPSSFLVRILHEGREIRMDSLNSFADFVESIRPSYDDCAVFYDYFPWLEDAGGLTWKG